MHPVIVGLVAILGLLAIVSVILFLWKAKSALAEHDALGADSDAMLIELTVKPSR
jgi:hypothetical protein